jgi:hypothetical protein
VLRSNDPTIAVALTPAGTCNGATPLAQASASVAVSLAAAETVAVTASAAKLAPVGDAAAAAGVATFSQLTVQLSYQGGTRYVDASADNRTVFDLSAAAGLFTIDTRSASSSRLVANTRGLVGTGTLVVRFTTRVW